VGELGRTEATEEKVMHLAAIGSATTEGEISGEN
jgi:hypothetical protein